MRAALVVVLLAGVAVWAAFACSPAAAAYEEGVVSTFADGSTSATLHFDAGCSSNASLALALPAEANVSNATMLMFVTFDLNRTAGTVVFDVGADRSVDGTNGISGSGTGPNGTNVTLSPGGFNASTRSQNATGGVVQVPLKIDSCSVPGGWTITLDRVRVVYSTGSPSSAHAPEFRGSVPDTSLPANSTLDTGINVPSFFVDADGDPLLYDAFTDADPTSPPPGLALTIDGSTGNLKATAYGGWAGAVRFHLVAKDPANQTARSNDATVTVFAPDLPPVFSGPIADLAATAGAPALGLLNLTPFFADPNGVPLSFAIVDRDASPLWGSIDLELRGALLDLTAAGDALSRGSACFALRATDVNGSTADSNRVCLKLVAPAPLPSVSFTVAAATPPQQKLTVQADAPLPPDAQVSWFIDGQLAGAGQSLSVVIAPGAHTVRVVVTSGGQAVENSRTIDIPAAPASPPPSAAAGISPGALYTLVGSLALLGLAASRVEVVRYFATGALLAGLFSRLKGESLLSHFTRGRLYQAISEHPGIRFNELKRLTNTSNGAAVHHLRVLVKGELITAVVDGAATRFYTTGTRLEEDEYGLLDADEEILEAVQQAPGLSIEALSKRIDRSPSSTSRAVSRLEDLGYLSRERKGRRAAVFPRLRHERAGTAAAATNRAP